MKTPPFIRHRSRDVVRHRRPLVMAAVIAVACLLTSCVSPAARKAERPFSPFSMWNFPIGPNARLVPSGIGIPGAANADVTYIINASGSDPLRNVYYDGHNFGANRCTADRPTGRQVRIPDSFFLGDARNGHTPNNALVIVQPDGSLEEFSVAARCLHDGAGRQKGEPGYSGAVDYNLYAVGAYTPGGIQTVNSSGEQGGRGASGVSALGGTIRAGELFSSAPIEHALAINLHAARLLYYGADRAGFRWPASRADDYAPGHYGGGNPALVIGSLLTIPRSVSPESIGVTNPVVRKIVEALKNYGAYVVEDSYYDDVDFALDAWANLEYLVRTRSGFGQDAAGTEMRRAIGATYVVDNNAPGNLGGGGQFDALRALAGRR